jgi:hypothetical protein
MHGTPPFQVYYRSQRDAEPPRDLVKTFTSSRGELTLQPELSGHYYYTFVQLSDAHYKKVALDGPSIDQIVHPLAAADFVGGRGRRVVSSCEGVTVGIEVDLRVGSLVGFDRLTLMRIRRARLLGTWSCRLLVHAVRMHWKSPISKRRPRGYWYPSPVSLTKRVEHLTLN